MSEEASATHRVIWSARSRTDLISIHRYIGQFAPLAAQRFTARLTGAAESLSRHPERGRPIHGKMRELVVISPYIIRYRVTTDLVEIVRIRHAARRPD